MTWRIESGKVAYGETSLDFIDAASFEALDKSFGRDASGVYWGIKPVDGVEHPERFRVLGGSFGTDGSVVYDGPEPLAGADAGTFEVLTEIYARDRRQVWVHDQPLAADVESFEALAVDVARDRRHVYQRDRIVQGADPATFEVLGINLARDRDRVFYGDRPVPEVDAASLCLLSDPSADTGYFRDHRKVYFAGYGKCPEVACDPSTFELVAGELARDRRHVFRWGRRIRGADPATFEILGCYHARDRHCVYAFADWHRKIRLLPDADPESFLDMDTGYGTDRRNLYYHGKKSNGCKLGDDDRVFDFIRAHPELVGYWWNKTVEVDLESFEVVADGYARDRRSVYLNGRRLEEVSPGGFRSLGHGFCADREAAYWFEVSRTGDLAWWAVDGDVLGGGGDRDGDRLDGTDPDRLEILGASHARERSCPSGSPVRRRCFFRNQPLAGADAATFEVLSPDVARDAERVWWFDKRVRKADARHFEMLSEGFGRDRRCVFWHGAEITKADVATFEILSHPNRAYARDRHSVYDANGHRVVRGLDGGTFRFLNSGYGADASSVYETSSERQLKHVDTASFRALSPWLAKDRANVFVHGRRERRLDPTSVEIVGEELVRDHRHVFWYNPAGMELTRLPGASPADIRVLWDGYATDGSLVFRGCEPVPASPGDLRRIGDGFVADGECVYYSSLLQVPDRANFELLGHGYARDENAVYYRGSRVEGADPPTFEILQTSPAGQFGFEIWWARDRRRVYLLNQPQPDLDPASFEVLGDGYSCDGEHVLFHQAVLPDVDARSFRVLGDGYARDSSQLLFDGARIR